MARCAPYAGLIALCLALYSPGLTTLPPFDRDEARFAQATRQMVDSGDFVRIHFQDEPRYKKPVGIHWLQAGVLAITGASETNQIWPYRIPSLLGAMAGVLLTFAFGSHLFGRRVAVLGASLLASCLLLVTEAHMATTDAVLLAAVVAAQGALALLYLGGSRKDAANLWPAVIFWSAQGIGMLVKGPVAPFCSVLTIGALCLADRTASWLRRLRPGLGLLLAAAIVGPWAMAASRASGGDFFERAFFSDLLPKLIAGQESHGFPPGYYLLLLAVTFWPASLFVWPGLLRAWNFRFQAAERFCLAWIIPTWLAFELIPTKLPHYVLATYPALALLAAQAIFNETGNSPFSKRLARVGILVWALVGLALATAIVLLPWFLDGRFQLLTLFPAAAAISTTVLSARRAFKGQLSAAGTVAVLGTIFILPVTLHAILPSIDALWLSRNVARAAGRPAEGGTTTDLVVAAGYQEPSLIFHLGRDTRLVSPAEAAWYLSSQPMTLAIISDKSDEPFHQRLTDLRRSARMLASVHGFNYTKGRWTTLRLYRADLETALH